MVCVWCVCVVCGVCVVWGLVLSQFHCTMEVEGALFWGSGCLFLTSKTRVFTWNRYTLATNFLIKIPSLPLQNTFLLSGSRR